MSLERLNPSAARSLQGELEEMLTINRLEIKKLEKPLHICKSVEDAFVYDNYRKNRKPFKLKSIYRALLVPAYSSIVLFRLQQFYYWKGQDYGRRIGRLYEYLSWAVSRLNFILNAGFETSQFADIAPGLFIHHTQGTIIGGDTKIGSNCHLFKNVLLGEKGGCYPNIKANVTIYANVTVIGGITINEHAVIAPNSLVIQDVQEETIVAGVPAKPIGKNTFVFIQKEGIPYLVLKDQTVQYGCK